jgi:hypothetical protein
VVVTPHDMTRGRPASRPLAEVDSPPATANTVSSKAALDVIVTHEADTAADADKLFGPGGERDQRSQLVLTAWRDGYRAGVGDLDDMVMQAFSDGWRCGLEAGAERRTAA